MKNFTEKVKELAMSLGAGIVGIASMERLERITPTGKVPSNLLEDGRSVVVYGVPLLRGAIRSEDLRLKRYNAVEACKKCDEISFNLAQYLERNGYDSLIIHADVPVDFEKDSMLGTCHCVMLRPRQA